MSDAKYCQKSSLPKPARSCKRVPIHLRDNYARRRVILPNWTVLVDFVRVNVNPGLRGRLADGRLWMRAPSAGDGRRSRQGERRKARGVGKETLRDKSSGRPDLGSCSWSLCDRNGTSRRPHWWTAIYEAISGRVPFEI